MRGRPQRRLTIAAAYDDEAGAVRLSVTDSGHGIDSANISRIFDPFFTTREVGEGTGLGLSICYGIVRDHGGHIDVESQPGVGTTFRVTLPARIDDLFGTGMEVLVAHGAQGEREFIAAVLSGWGCRPVIASTLRQALDGCRRPALQLAIVDRGILAEDVAAWRALGAEAGGTLPMVLTCRTSDDDPAEWFGGSPAIVMQPIELRALRAAVRASVKEYV
jgi:hypothetical protein